MSQKIGKDGEPGRVTRPADWIVVSGLLVVVGGTVTAIGGKIVNDPELVTRGLEVAGAGFVVAVMAAPSSNLN